jgi:hypothetical protein
MNYDEKLLDDIKAELMRWALGGMRNPAVLASLLKRIDAAEDSGLDFNVDVPTDLLGTPTVTFAEPLPMEVAGRVYRLKIYPLDKTARLYDLDHWKLVKETKYTDKPPEETIRRR